MWKPEPDRNARLMREALAYADGLHNVAYHLTRNAAERMAARLKAAGIEQAQVFTAPGHPKEGGVFAVFPGSDPKKPVDLRAPFESALKQARLENFHWHDLRHTCASYLAMNGASLAEIAEVLGHKTLQMVKRYAHLSQAHTARVVASMNDKIFGSMNG